MSKTCLGVFLEFLYEALRLQERFRFVFGKTEQVFFCFLFDFYSINHIHDVLRKPLNLLPEAFRETVLAQPGPA